VKVNDAIIGSVLMLFAAAVFAYTRTFPSVPGQEYGPGLFPGLIAVGLFASGVALIVKGIRDRRSAPWVVLADWVRSSRHLVSFLLGIGGMVFYILGVPVLGFVVTSIILLVILLVWLRGRPLSSLVVGVVVSGGTYLVFHQVLRVPLATGPFMPAGW